MSSTPKTRAAARLRLSEVSADIGNLEIALAPLPAEQKAIQEYLDAYSYPFSTLPNEIVSEIFLQYMPVYPERPLLRGDGSPEKLAQICRRWREIAHSTPGLWRAMHIINPHPGALCLAQQWLERSRALPLSIRLYNGYDVPHRAASAVKTLLVHRLRWQYISLFLPYHRGLPVLGGNFPLLKALELSFDAGMHFSNITAVNLTTVHLWRWDPPSDWFADKKFLPWKQLTTLLLGKVYHDFTAMVLRETESLVRCRLFGLIFDDEPMIGTTMRMNALETFIVDFSEPSNVAAELFRPLNIPNLKHLSIHDGVIEQHNRRLPTLLSIIDGFGCTLDRLSIASQTLTTEQCRAAFPNVAHVEVTGYSSEVALSPEIWGYWNTDEYVHGEEE
ncbi:F-box domain-containing protein [Mycena kentingensis (nom. inval.)]|nr:F-box domain-containing protein [Mycena kentingensis (nom. inval.)]